MTVNMNHTPNFLHIGGDSPTVSAYFGALHGSVTAHQMPGLGHRRTLVARFDNNVRMELDPAMAVVFAKELLRAAESMSEAEYGGACWQGEDV